MNTMTAIPCTVGEDGIWLHFVSPTSGKQSSLNLGSIIEKTGGIVSEAVTEWAQAQIAVRAIHNPPINEVR